MPSAADRNLLVGILALQMEFISQAQLIEAMQAWVLNKELPLEALLLKREALRQDTHDLLVALVEKHLELHEEDPKKSLASLSTIGTGREKLRDVGDRDVEASLALVSSGFDPNATMTQNLRGLDGVRFQVLRPHAEGGLGRVSVAHDNELNREIALKEIREQFADDDEARSRFIVEGEITGGLEHPGIVPVYGLGQYADGRPFYAMRFIRGDSLKESIRRLHDSELVDLRTKAFELRELLGRFIDVCNAIEYAHSRGVLHRDLKPGNIMLGQYGETLVVDWGLAKALGEGKPGAPEATLNPSSGSGSAHSVMGVAVGTPVFMSPEQADGRFDLMGPATDVYGLGATLYTLLTGKVPFFGNGTPEILRKVRKGELERPRKVQPTVPAALEAICLRAMAVQPQDRYASPLDIASDIQHWMADEPVSAYAEPLYARSRRWIRRNQTTAITGATVLTVLLISAAILLWQRRQNEITLLRLDNAENKAAVEEAKAQIAVAQNESILLKAQTSNYLRQRAEVDRLLNQEPRGWLTDAATALKEINADYSLLSDFDANWLTNATLRLQMGTELTQIKSADEYSFPLGQFRFSENGKYAILSQYRGGSAATSLSLALYDVAERSAVRQLKLGVGATTLSSLFDSLRTLERTKPEGINDVLVSEKLDAIVALTRKGNIAIWSLSDSEAPPRMIVGEPEPSPVRILADETSRSLFVVRGDVVQEISLDATEFKPTNEWPFEAFAKQAVWDAERKRILVAVGHAVVAIDTKSAGGKPQRVELDAKQIGLVADRRLLVCVGTRACRMLDADTLEELEQFPLVGASMPELDIVGMDVSFDGVFMTLCLRGEREERWVELWNLASGEKLQRVPGSDLSQQGFPFVPNSYELALIESRGISWWDIQGTNPQRWCAMNARPIRDVAWDSQEYSLLLARQDSVGLWSQSSPHYSKKATKNVDGVANVVMSRLGERGLVHRSFSGGGGYVVQLQKDAAEFRFGEVEERSMRTAVYDPVGGESLFAVTTSSDRLGITSADSVSHLEVPGWDEIASWNDLGGANIVTGRGTVLSLAVDETSVFTGLRNGTVRRHPRDFVKAPLARKTVASGAAISILAVGPKLPITDAQSPSGIGSISKRLAVGSFSGELLVLDALTLETIADLEPHSGACSTMFWLSATDLVTGGSDGELRCTRLAAQPEELWRINFPAPILKAGLAGENVLVLLQGERAIRRYPASLFKRVESEEGNSPSFSE